MEASQLSHTGNAICPSPLTTHACVGKVLDPNISQPDITWPDNTKPCFEILPACALPNTTPAKPRQVCRTLIHKQLNCHINQSDETSCHVTDVFICHCHSFQNQIHENLTDFLYFRSSIFVIWRFWCKRLFLIACLP